MLPKLRRFLSKFKLSKLRKKENPPLPASTTTQEQHTNVAQTPTGALSSSAQGVPSKSTIINTTQAPSMFLKSKPPVPPDSSATQRTAHDAIEISSLSAWILNGEVQRESERAFTGGGKSDIWQGIWKGEKVALKVLRDVRSDDQGVQKHLLRVIRTWSGLDHRNILRCYGFITDIGVHITIVCPWFNNGNVLDYIVRHPDANRIHFLLGAAEGLEYLHSQKVIHQNANHGDQHNILVSDLGEACICDFDLVGIYHGGDNYNTSSSVEATARQVRWLAPEIVGDSREVPTEASDVYSFGMAILELLTGKQPFAEIGRDVAVVSAILSQSARPKRPADPAAQRWLTDGMWVLLERCWLGDPSSRPSMGDIVVNLREIE
ncbi:kinase-like protein [Macrolepiota fuliginosa MF-IS2]|uniref:Kinase-like protein n=1 Tax=Macrolepiota fuliginosa MF-IS2 TaxID=1400762 RepID=A0A9P5XFC3_9AGAR|nr:kinase-like protein [Macrolepiota fuliginosa MF-IS2]